MRDFAAVPGAYRRATGERVLLSWIGGEPLLWQPVFGLSAWMVDCHGIGVSATTNGTTLHLPGVRRQVLATFSELMVSVDGFADLHDRLRGWRRGWDRLKAAVGALAVERRLAARACRLRANVVLMHGNLPDFERLCASPAYLQRIAASAVGNSLPVPDCGPGERFLFIDERSRIAPCHFTTEELGVPLAQVGTVSELMALAPRFAAARRASRPAACADCPSTQVFAKFAS